MTFRGAFFVSNTDPTGQQTAYYAIPTAGHLGLFVLPAILLFELRRLVRREGRRPKPTSYLAVVTDKGLGLGICGAVFGRLRRWHSPPAAGQRYELDPTEVSKRLDTVQLTIGGQTFFAAGSNRDNAFRLYGQQPR